MLPTHQGSIHLFRVAGISVYLHWSWFIVALYMVQSRSAQYSSYVWNALEYVALFGIVLLHEFGHSLACRQVGGRADQIVLWPLGGIAYVAPPPRPGATLWSIAAGPLVNVALLPVFTGLLGLASFLGWPETLPNVQRFLYAVWFINLLLLVFNLLPIYPLDGGQIVRALLWFVVGRARSLMLATFLGFAGVLALVVLALLLKSVWMGVIAAFVLLSSWAGLKNARTLMRLSRLPRHDMFRCPVCQEPALRGPYWRCEGCHQLYDPFESHAQCPHCGAATGDCPCVDCGTAHPVDQWRISA